MEESRREPFHWQTAIAYKTRTRIVVRGYDFEELMAHLDVGEMAYLVWRGDLPSPSHARMLNAIMVALAEHAFSPSSAAARLVASGGVPLQAAVAGGLLAIGDLHGTFDRPARLFQAGVARAAAEDRTVDDMADVLVREARAARERLPGFHHPQHVRDPRAAPLLGLAARWGVTGDHQRLAVAMEAATPRHYGRPLWLNAVGACGAILSDMGFSPVQAKGVMLGARCISLVAHAQEETAREPSWRASTRATVTQPLDLELQGPAFYDGPPDRPFPADRRRPD